MFGITRESKREREREHEERSMEMDGQTNVDRVLEV